MSHAKLIAARGVEIGVEDAGAAPELKLEAGALADLQGGRTEVPDKIVRRQAEQLPRLRRGRLGWWRLLDDRLLGPAGAGGEEQGR